MARAAKDRPFRVMLAAKTAKADWGSFKFPLLASPKIDGIRATVKDGRLISRSCKLIPNAFTNSLFGRPEYEGFDGELVVGSPNDKNLMQQTSSGVMTRSGTPDVTWWLFDNRLHLMPFKDRFTLLTREYEGITQQAEALGVRTHMRLVPHTLIKTFAELEMYEEHMVERGFEGVMLRLPSGPYKEGRSTLREGYLLKVKRFEDAEAEVIGVVEQMTNTNEATEDERGYTKRSTHQAGKVAAGILGALQVRDIRTGVEFDVGTGFTHEQRVNLWKGRKYLIGKIVAYKYFVVGVVDRPRFPTFVAFRDPRDM